MVLIQKLNISLTKLGKVLGLLILCSLSFGVVAQSGEKVDIFSPADSLIGINKDGVEQRKLMGHVSLRQGTTLLYCDIAIMNPLTNNVEAYGHVKIIQADTVTITGDSATYYGNIRLAKISGRVLLDDRTIKLSTKRMDYDLNARLAVYNTGGKITDKDGQILTSKEGIYNTVSKVMLFQKNVKINNPKEKFTLTADSLRYSTYSKEAFFIAPTKIVSKTDTMTVNSGIYNTKNKISNFIGRSTVKTSDYDITGDTLFSDTPSEIRIARGNVIFVSKKDKSILTGNYGVASGKTGMTKVHGNALMQTWQGRDSTQASADTLYLSADTLISIDNKETKLRKMLAYKKVLIFRKDFQGRCDSLAYNTSDSTIFFYQKPILWNPESQSEADSINVLMKANRPYLMNMKGKSFVIQQDSVKNFNQIKGRKITVNFNDKGGLEKVNVEGNGESVYYALTEKNETTGLNRVQCSRMLMNFREGKVKRIAFYTKPEAKFVPPHEMTPSIKFLEDFQWKEADRPTKAKTIAPRILPKVKKDSTQNKDIPSKILAKNDSIKARPEERKLLKKKKL
jgi:lipopolysaccharide export system protein LptA